MIFPHKLFPGDYLFLCDSADNNDVVLIHPTPEIADTPEAEILEKEVVDTMGEDMLEEME